MKYQLVLHNGVAPSEMLAQAPDLPNEASVNGWYAEESVKHHVPDGQSLSMVGEDHPWYKRSAEPKPLSQVSTGFPSPPVVEDDRFVIGTQPSFNDLMAEANKRWEQEEKDAVLEREALAVVLRNFNQRR